MDMATLLKQTLLFTEDNATSSQVDSLANHTALQENEKVKKMNATSGLKCLELLGRFNQPTLWVKMLAASLVGTGDWYSTKCKLNWKLKGTKYNRLYFQLVPKTLRTEGIGFGLLPTPTVAETIEPKEARKVFGNMRIKSNNGVEGQCKLTDLAMNGLLPTPNAMEFNKTKHPLYVTKTGTIRSKHISGKTSQVGLEHQLNHLTGQSGQLNPLFLAEMMGFPNNWTELPFLSGETKV